MRRALPVLLLALVCAAPAGARAPSSSEGPRVRVLVELASPPLARHGARALYGVGTARRLDVHSRSSRAYLRTLAREQARVATRIRARIPQARIGRRFRVVLNALTVSLPATKLPGLLATPSVRKVYPSLSYTLALDRSPAVIGADVLRRTTGADGRGVKIAVVDDGIDPTNPFFSPAGFSYPPGFPKGETSATTPKVIVARVFPGPGSGRAGRLLVDPDSSFHGTHVAGIAAGDAGTTAPAGRDHPAVAGLSGVAPRAWLGNYRVFTVPTPIGRVANTPEVVAAFEAAVGDGMDVVNFSGGGPQVDPASDALVEAVQDVAAAGVVPVIAAGNDRDDFGDGSAGSPASAPDAISVAAVSNAHVFAAALDVVSPGAPADLRGIPFRGANDAAAPAAWSAADQTLVDVGAITGTDGKPVERHLCRSTLPPGSLHGAIALVDRGRCPLQAKAQRAQAAGAVGVVYAENRAGEAQVLPVSPVVPGGSVADLDAARLRAFAATRGGRVAVRIGRTPLELETGRSGIVTSFSSDGPTPFGHRLGPDVAAPGGQILSSTLPRIDPSRFAVFDGTSMAAPHVSGAAALLLQLHPSWTVAEVRAALVSTADAAWADTARTREAPVTLEGGGLVSLPAAADPRLFTAPSSLSFGDLAVGSGAAQRSLLVQLRDAGGGEGTWQVRLDTQAATAGAGLDVAGVVVVPPGGTATMQVDARAAAGAPAGENYGFVVLEQDGVTRRIPYLFLVDHPGLAAATPVTLRREQRGDTRTGRSLVAAYRYPTAPFGYEPDRPPMQEDGAERVYTFRLPRKAVNVGVAAVERSSGARIDPFLLGRLDESTVQGFAGTPVDVNPLTYDYLSPIGVAGATFPQAGRYYVAVDSGRDPVTGRSLAGRYVLRFWVNDVTPPRLELLTTRVSAGRPTLAFRAVDGQSGVDPASLTLAYRGALLSVGSYDRLTGVALFPLPGSVPALRAGTARATIVASDFQEAKNVDTRGGKVMPNTRQQTDRLRVVAGPAVDWLVPAARACLARPERLSVVAGSPAAVRTVAFLLDGRRVAVDRSGDEGVWSAILRRRPARGTHRLTAVAVDRQGRRATATRTVRACG